MKKDTHRIPYYQPDCQLFVCHKIEELGEVLVIELQYYFRLVSDGQPNAWA
jgi:hypothetical protein